jgi:hypothetical protein
MRHDNLLGAVVALALLVSVSVGCASVPAATTVVEAPAATSTQAPPTVTDTAEVPTATPTPQPPTITPTPEPPTATPTPEPPTATPTAAQDPELLAFAKELDEINQRLREGIFGALTAQADEWEDAMTVLAEIHRDAEKLEIPEDNEVAQTLVPLLLECTSNFQEDTSINQFLRAVPDCQTYIELLNKLAEEE